MKTIAMCPLVSRDMQRSMRAVRSCMLQRPTQNYTFVTHPIVNSRNEEFIADFTAWCHTAGVEFDVTPSNGTPSRGKNEVLRYFRRSGHDGVVMLDGDDLMYPVAAQQIDRHVSQHTGTDLLIVKPSDTVVSYDEAGRGKLPDGRHAILWGTNTCKMGYQYGPGRHRMFDDGHPAARNIGGHVYYSRKLAELISYDEEQLLGEDLLFEFEAFRLHVEGRISFWLSFASDVQLLDRTIENSGVQHENNTTTGDACYERLLSKVSGLVDHERSSFEELPVDFPPLLMTYQEKMQFIAESF